jgi:Mrp family chromosome partitioning ATPase
LSLAFSFAAAGVRTLLIDGDLTSRRVTMALDAGEASGLIEAMAGVEPFVQRIRAGPSVLTAGKSSSHDACRLVPTALRRVLANLRERFDVILIDGDPMLTGITATVIAPQTDGVIFAVGNGQRPGLVHQAIGQIRMQGTDLLVAVFNKACASELPIEVKDREAAAAAKHRALPEKVRRLGPLVATVLASIRHTREEDLELTSGLDLARTDTPTHTGEQAHEAHDRRAQGRSAA